MTTSIEGFLNKRVLVVPYHVSVQEAARALYENAVGSAVVSDGHGRMIGMVTDRDLATQILAFGRSRTTAVSEVMTEEIECVGETATLDEVIELMMQFGVRRIPVITRTVNGREHCVGIITLDDLLAAEAIGPAAAGAIVRSQMRAPRWPTREILKVSGGDTARGNGNGIAFLFDSTL